jgi:uronate dehydrogenase
MSTPAPRHILVTGASGAIGAPLCRHLVQRGHRVRGFSLEPHPDLEDSQTGDLADQEAVRRAVSDVHTIVHLGAYPDDANFLDDLLEPNVRGLYHICAAAVEAGVQRLILASSLQVISGLDHEGTICIEHGTAPTNHYALTKIWAESMGEMYARIHRLSVILVRIGWYPRNSREAGQLAGWSDGPNFYLSHPDSQRFFTRCVEAEAPLPGQCATLFATSRPLTRQRLDPEAASRVIGYEPQDTWPAGLPFPHK